MAQMASRNACAGVKLPTHMMSFDAGGSDASSGGESVGGATTGGSS